MDTLFRSLMYEWDYKNRLRDAMFRDMPEYRDLERELSHATEALEEALSPEAQKLFNRYENARTAFSALEADASFLCGAHVCLRLLITLL